MVRLLPVLTAVTAAALAFAAPAASEPAPATPCSGMDSIGYGLEIATGTPPATYTSENCVRCECDACYPTACQCDVYCYCVKHSSDLIWCLHTLNDMWCAGEPNPVG